MSDPTWAEYAPWTVYYESTFRNIANEAGASSATGYFQIIKGTWEKYGAKVPGALDYAQAMDAPYRTQYAVAEQVFLWQGIKAWETWPKIVAAVGAAAPPPVTAPQPIPTPSPASPAPAPDMTLATLLKLSAALPSLENAAATIQTIIKEITAT